MASNAELHLIEGFLKLSGMKVIDYRIIEDIGRFLSLKNTKKPIICPRCGKKTEFLLDQNNLVTIRDLSLGEPPVYLKVNRRLLRCSHCHKKFSEDLEFVRKRRSYTKRLVEKILEEVLSSDISPVKVA